MGQMAPGEGVPHLKRVSTVVMKDADNSKFKNIYYNDTEGVGGVKDIIARFETILDIQNHGSPGLGGLKNGKLELDIFGEDTHFWLNGDGSPSAILGRSWVEEG